MGLSDKGYTGLTTAQALQKFRADFEAELLAKGLPTSVSWAANTFLGVISVAFSVGIASVYGAIQAVYDGTQVRNATGIQLANLAELVGVKQQDATLGTITLALTGVAGVTVPAGSLASGTSNPSIMWALDTDTVLTAGSVIATFIATTAGNYPEQDAEVWTVVSAVSGWTGATSATDAIAGQDVETESELRLRRNARIVTSKDSSTGAMAAKLNAIADIEAAQVIENDRHYTQTIEGKILPPNSINAIIWPNIDAKPGVISEVAKTLYANTIGILAYGSDVVTTVTGSDGLQKTVSFDYATSITVNVVVAITKFVAGAAQASVKSDIEAGITAYFDALIVGEDVSLLAIQCIIQGTGGVLSATITLNGNPANVVITSTQVGVLGTLTVTP